MERVNTDSRCPEGFFIFLKFSYTKNYLSYIKKWISLIKKSEDFFQDLKIKIF